MLSNTNNSIKQQSFVYTQLNDQTVLVSISHLLAHSAGAIEYTDCYPAEVWDPPTHMCPSYDTKQSDGEAPVMLEFWGMWRTSLLSYSKVHSVPKW